MEDIKQNNYFAFISYSRKDIAVANWLHGKLENYPYPPKGVLKDYCPPDKKYLRPIFLDIKDLHSEDRPFTKEVETALANSQYLILLCSRNSAKSKFVDFEARYFLSVHNNETSRVVPLFIDEVVPESVPSIVAETSIMNRHFPIYNTGLGKRSEANEYCFFQLVSYMLRIDFSKIYDRYEHYKQKKQNRKTAFFSYTIIALLCILVAIWFKFKAEKELAEFEKEVFPAAVVFGYEENFLFPVISYLKEHDKKDFYIYVLMPKNKQDLSHRRRVVDLNHYIEKEIDIDSISPERLATETERGSNVFRLYRNGEKIPDIYIDFAYTTSSFVRIADYKIEGHSKYHDLNEDEIILEYTNEFIRQTKEELHEDSVYVKFYTDKKEMVSSIQKLYNKHAR